MIVVQQMWMKWGWAAILLGSMAAGVWAAPASGRDTLTYKDGDRVQGTLVAEAGGVFVFKSDRFGELRVPVAEAAVAKGAPAPTASTTKPPPAIAPAEASAPPAPPAAGDDERPSIWERFTPAALTAQVRTFFGPWRGRLSFSAEVVTDSAERATSSYEAQLRRKWKADDVQLNSRFDYSETNDVTTTDVLKFWGHWRHDFSPRLFAHYRPTSEWNRASRLRGVPNDYVLLQQEIGAGWQFQTKPGRKARVGVSENLFDTWNSAPGAGHVSRGVISVFEETEFALPWRTTLAQRGVWYPSGARSDGWENRIDLNKKLTETLSTSLRHEIRRNNPDGTAQDYTRLKLLFGLDF
ncbi:MAG: DUF481 domain-containing protein [Opitutaceae bacterium]|nr:DUF481 domain-containing protein [Opitutaceae bacterium]